MSATREPLLDLVRRLLSERDIEYQRHADGLAVLHGSADVLISVNEAQATITMTAVVLCELELEDAEHEIRVLRSLNDRNSRLQYGRFYYDPEQQSVIHDFRILGSHLQAPELLNGLIAVARTADEHDDLLREELGTGVRAADRAGRREASASF